jgi:citrate/tricarballylate utilization protein
MYTPPHEFALNIPQIMSEVRIESYRHWSWPSILSRSFTRQSIAVITGISAAAFVVVCSLFLIGPSRLIARNAGPGAFYKIVPYLAMVIPALVLFLYGFAIWLRGSLKSWSEQTSMPRKQTSIRALVKALGAVLALRYLHGGGPGCTYPQDRPTSVRRIYHSLVSCGFLLDFASTTLAYVYQDWFHRLPPYPLASAPVLLGAVGGVGLIVGTAGLILIKIKSDRTPAGSGAYSMDYTFLVTLGLTALTGMLTLIFRDTAALGSLLVLHLAITASLFITAPYGKFVHFLYRTVSVLKYEIEEQDGKDRGFGAGI